MSVRRKIAKRNFTEPRINELFKALLKTKSRFWKAIAEKLAKPRRERIIVNVGKINRLAREGETVVVPGKVLGSGVIEKKVTVVAYDFSLKAREKIEKAGGKAVLIEETLKNNPEGKGLKIVI